MYRTFPILWGAFPAHFCNKELQAVFSSVVSTSANNFAIARLYLIGITEELGGQYGIDNIKSVVEDRAIAAREVPKMH